MAADMNQVAQQIWSMLDNMAAEDPESYSKFIDKQLKEGKEALKPPNPYLCVQTLLHENDNDTMIFINIMEWPKVPSPKTNDDPIPTVGGPIYSTKEKYDEYKCVSVAFNPSILEEYGNECSSKDETHMLVCLAIDYLQELHRVSISKNYTLLPKSMRCKGSQILAVQSLVQKLEGKGELFEKNLHALEKTLGPVATGCKESLLSQLSSLGVSDGAGLNSEESLSKLVFPDEVKAKSVRKGQLIEELSSSPAVLQEPKFELKIKEANERLMELEIKLPGVSSANEFSVDISEDDVYLLVPEKFELTLKLPHVTSVEDSSAQFFKQNSSLILTMPIRN